MKGKETVIILACLSSTEDWLILYLWC